MDLLVIFHSISDSGTVRKFSDTVRSHFRAASWVRTISHPQKQVLIPRRLQNLPHQIQELKHLVNQVLQEVHPRQMCGPQRSHLSRQGPPTGKLKAVPIHSGRPNPML